MQVISMFQAAKQEVLLARKNQDTAQRKQVLKSPLITSKAFSVVVDNRT
jgi:hypothetical protein